MVEGKGRGVPAKENTLQARLDTNTARFNDLSQAITQGQQQLAVWAEERLRVAGQISLLQELLKEN